MQELSVETFKHGIEFQRMTYSYPKKPTHLYNIKIEKHSSVK